MLANLITRAGLALASKGMTMGSFTATDAEWFRKWPGLARNWGLGAMTATGRSVTEFTALNCSTVWACQRVIAETIGSLPLHLMTYTDAGKVPADGNQGRPLHPLFWVLHDEMNDDTSAMVGRETLTAHAVTWGNAFALKVRRGGTGQTVGLHIWKPSETWVRRDAAGNKVFVHKDGNSSEKTYLSADVFHLPGLGFDGTQGYSVVNMGRESIALSEIQDEYVSKFFAAGGRKPYYITKKSPFKTDQDFEKWRDGWTKAYGSADGFHTAPLLEGADMELHELGMPLQDAQLLTSRQFSVPEICRWFRISPHLVGDLSRATFSNIEQLSIEFVTQTLMAWMVRWEQEVNRQLLTNGEKGKYFAKHNVDALLRGDFASRMAGYASALQNGHLSINEVRDLEDRNPIEGGDDHHIQLNMQALPGETPTSAQAAALVKVGRNGGQQNAA